MPIRYFLFRRYPACKPTATASPMMTGARSLLPSHHISLIAMIPAITSEAHNKNLIRLSYLENPSCQYPPGGFWDTLFHTITQWGIIENEVFSLVGKGVGNPKMRKMGKRLLLWPEKRRSYHPPPSQPLTQQPPTQQRCRKASPQPQVSRALGSRMASLVATEPRLCCCTATSLIKLG